MASKRLTEAQRRVLEAMRDGWELRRSEAAWLLRVPGNLQYDVALDMLKDALEAGLIELSVSSRCARSLDTYRLTDAGRAALEQDK